MKNSGQIVVFILILLASGFGLAVAVFSMMGHNSILIGIEINRERALQLSEAGVNRALFELNRNANWTGVGETTLGAGSYEVIVTNLGASRLVEARGYIPSRQAPRASRAVRVIMTHSPGADSFRYGVQTGTGGLEMSSNAVVHGNVYSNANIVCLSNSVIRGDGFAVGTISPSNCPTGQSRPGVAISSMPAFDRDFWIRAAEAGGISASISYNEGVNRLGPKRINGNLAVNSEATLVVTGPIYVTGTVEVNANSIVRLDDSFARNGTVILSDSRIAINANSQIVRSSQGGYIMLVSDQPSGVAIQLNSNTRGGIYYARFATVEVNANSHPIALTGHRIVLNSNSEIFYDHGLPEQSFTSGPGGGWVIQRGTWRIIPR
jgi:hypothetical protein